MKNDSELTRKRYFIFMDESGNTQEENFFGLGLLFVPTNLVGHVYDDMRSFFDRAKDIAKAKKNEKVLEYITQQNFENLGKIMTANRDFELKFKNINFTNKDIYKGIIDKYFSYPEIKFSSLIIEKKNGSEKYDYWDLYILRASMLIANNIKLDPDAEYVLVCDGITQPKGKLKKFELSMIDGINFYLKKHKISGNVLFGVLREESHASFLLQLVDILLGATMYFTKKKQGLITEKTETKKGLVADTLKKKVGNYDFTENFTSNKPNYFSVRHYNK